MMETKPWSAIYEGSKKEIHDKVNKDSIPDEVKAAIIALLDLHADKPGWTDEDPADKWEREVPHTSADVAPPRREELWDSWWRAEAGGHPTAHSPSIIRIDPIRRAK